MSYFAQARAEGRAQPGCLAVLPRAKGELDRSCQRDTGDADVGMLIRHDDSGVNSGADVLLMRSHFGDDRRVVIMGCLAGKRIRSHVPPGL